MSALPSIGSIVDQYRAAGFALVPIPPDTKGPSTPGWNKQENCVNATIPANYGVGIAHAYSGTMALDIDNWAETVKLLPEIEQLFASPDSVAITSGRPGRAKLLFRMPFGLVLPSKKVAYTADDGTKPVAYELRCGTANGLTVQDVLPMPNHNHPDTGKPYQWTGNGHFSRIPTIPASLLEHWHKLVDSDVQKTVQVSGTHTADWNEVESALHAVDPSCGRETWVECGMALRSTDNPNAFILWNDWSRQSDKYPGEREIAKQWTSFTPDGGITIATLFHHAIEAGWKRPDPDVSSLFGEMRTPDLVLDCLRPTAPDIDLNVFPELLRTRAAEVAHERGCDPIVPLFAGLASISAAADKRIKLELVRDWSVRPIIWLMTVGAPGDKKSPGSKPMYEPLSDIEFEDRPNFRKAMLDWEGKEAAYAAAKKAFLDHYKSADALLDTDEIPGVPELPPAPVPLRFTVSDVTSQKVVRMAADRPRGLTCVLDEMGSWVRKMNDHNSGEDRGSWLQSFEGGRYLMDRVGTGSTDAENLAISIYGNIQPGVLKSEMGKLSSDGLIQRFIPGVLHYEQTWKGQAAVSDLFTHKAAWVELLRRTYSLQPMVYTLSPEAYRLFDAFQDRFEIMRRDNRLLNASDIYMTAFSKLLSTVGRIALIMHLIDQPYEKHVSEKTMQNAIAFIEWYVIPSLEYTYLEISGLFEDSLENWILNHLQYLANDTDRISLSELKRSARRQLEGMSRWQQDGAIRSAMHYIEDANWASIIEDNQKTTVWLLNPKLKGAFPEHNKAVLIARQRKQDRRREIAIRAGAYVERTLIKGYNPDWDRL